MKIKNDKIKIDHCIKEINKIHKQKLGVIGPILGMVLILLFVLSLLPLYLFMIVFNHLYFWIRRQEKIDPKPYYNYDRHKLPHLSFADKVWCEYCEWANGTLQWTLAVTNEIERRYCPIQNHCHPHCEKAKKWRIDFLPYEHKGDDLKRYYSERYLQESNVIPDDK